MPAFVSVRATASVSNMRRSTTRSRPRAQRRYVRASSRAARLCAPEQPVRKRRVRQPAGCRHLRLHAGNDGLRRPVHRAGERRRQVSTGYALAVPRRQAPLDLSRRPVTVSHTVLFKDTETIMTTM